MQPYHQKLTTYLQAGNLNKTQMVFALLNFTKKQ